MADWYSLLTGKRKIITIGDGNGYYDLDRQMSIIGPPPEDAQVVGHVDRELGKVVVEESVAKEHAKDVDAIAEVNDAEVETVEKVEPTSYSTSKSQHRSHHHHHRSSSGPPQNPDAWKNAGDVEKETPRLAVDTSKPSSPEDVFYQNMGKGGFSDILQAGAATISLIGRRFNEGFNALSGGEDAIKEDWEKGMPLRAIGRAINGVIAGAGWSILTAPDSIGKGINAAIHDIPPEYWDTAASQKYSGVVMSAATATLTMGMGYLDTLPNPKPGTVEVTRAWYDQADDTLNATLVVKHRTGLGRTITRTVGVTDKGVGKVGIQIVKVGKNYTHTRGWSIRTSTVGIADDVGRSVLPTVSRNMDDVMQVGDDLLYTTYNKTVTPAGSSKSQIIGRKISGTVGGKMKVEIQGISEVPDAYGAHKYIVEGTVNVGDLARISRPPVEPDTVNTIAPSRLKSLLGSSDDVASAPKSRPTSSPKATPSSSGSGVLSVAQSAESAATTSATSSVSTTVSSALPNVIDDIASEVSSTWAGAVGSTGASTVASGIEAGVNSDTANKTRTSQRSRSKSRSRHRHKPRQNASQYQDFGGMEDAVQDIQDTSQDQDAGQTPDQDVWSGTDTSTALGTTPTFVPPTPPAPSTPQVPIELPAQPVPKISLDLPTHRTHKISRATKRIPQSAKYKPSLVAIDLDIRANPEKITTGVEIRPLPMVQKHKRQKRKTSKNVKKKRGFGWIL